MTKLTDMIAMIWELSLRTAIATTTEAPPDVYTNNDFMTPPRLTDAQPDVYSPNVTDVDRKLTQRVEAANTYTEPVYRSRLGWLWGTIAIFVVTFVAILPVSGGWWHLGRALTMTPIETAKAFDAQVMSGADSNGTASELVAHSASRQVVHGAFPSHSDVRLEEMSKAGLETEISNALIARIARRKLRFGIDKMHLANTPRDGERFR